MALGLRFAQSPHRLRPLARKLAVRAGLHPHVASLCMPFKLVEFRALVARTRFRGDERVLDLGCGPGLHALILARRVREVVGVDISPGNIAEARRRAEESFPERRVRFLCGHVQDLPLAPASFDKVLSFCVIEHIPEYREVLARCHDLLRLGGEMVLSADAMETITDPELLARHRREHHVHRYFRRDSLRSALEDAGFEVTAMETLFRSRRARRVFSAELLHPRRYGLLGTLLESSRLRLHDRLTPRSRPGLFLIAAARRPS